MSVSRTVGLVTCALLCACGGDDPGTPSSAASSSASSGGGGSGGGGGADVAVTAGIPDCAPDFVDADGVCRPSLAKCPAGSIPKLDQGCIQVGVPSCAAIFVGADGLCHAKTSACQGDTYPVPTEGCVPVDGADGCGAAPFGPIPDAPGTIYVDPTFEGVSDGTKASPFATLAAGLAAVGSGGVVALAAGTYDEPIAPTQPVTVIGRCPSLVKVSGTSKSPAGQVIVYIGTAASGSHIERLDLSGPGGGVYATDAVTLDTLRVHDVDGFGIAGQGGSAKVVAHHVLVRDVKLAAVGKGAGVDAVSKADVQIDASAIVRSVGNGLGADGGSIEAHDLLIEEILVGEDLASGVLVRENGTVTLDASVVVKSRTSGVQAFGGHAVVKRSVIDGVHDPTYGAGIYAQEATGTAEVEDSAILDTDVGGVQAYTGGKATVKRCLVARSSYSDGSSGIGVGSASTAAVEDSTFTDHHGAGAYVYEGSTLVATRSLFVSNLPSDHGTRGMGILADGDDTKLTLDRCAAIDNPYGGLFVQLGATASITDSAVLRTRADTTGENGSGIVFFNAASSTLERTRVEDSLVSGIALIGTPASLVDNRVGGVKSGTYNVAPSPPIPGVADGILIVGGIMGASVDVSSCHVESAERAGLLVSSAGGALHASRITGNAYGVALENGATFSLGEDNAVVSNGEDLPPAPMLPVP